MADRRRAVCGQQHRPFRNRAVGLRDRRAPGGRPPAARVGPGRRRRHSRPAGSASSAGRGRPGCAARRSRPRPPDGPSRSAAAPAPRGHRSPRPAARPPRRAPSRPPASRRRRRRPRRPARRCSWRPAPARERRRSARRRPTCGGAARPQQLGQGRARLRAGERRARPVLLDVDDGRLQLRRQDLAHIGDLRRHAVRAAGRAGQEVALLLQPPDRAVVHDEAVLAQHEGVAPAPDGELGHARGADPLQQGRRVRTGDLELRQRRDVGQAERRAHRPGLAQRRLLQRSRRNGERRADATSSRTAARSARAPRAGRAAPSAAAGPHGRPRPRRRARPG